MMARMELSLHRLKLLVELERRGTVTATAGALHYTVSAVSQQLAQLESEVGTPLLRRHGRGVVLTEAGVLLAEHGRRVLDSVDDAARALEALGEGTAATLTAGVWASVATGLMPATLERLALTEPGLRVRTRELAPEETAGAVRDGSLDLSFVIDYSSYPEPLAPDLERHVVAVERMHAAVPAGFPPGPVPLAELAEHPWVLAGPRSQFGRAVRMACRQEGFEPVVAHEVGEQSTALALVTAGLGVTLVSDLGMRVGADRPELRELAEDFSRTVSVVHRRVDAGRASLRAFTEAVTVAARDLGLLEAGVVPVAHEAEGPQLVDDEVDGHRDDDGQ